MQHNQGMHGSFVNAQENKHMHPKKQGEQLHKPPSYPFKDYWNIHHEKKEKQLPEEFSTVLQESFEEHLKEYILFNLSQGYEIEAIMSCLKQYGYKEKQLQAVIQQLPHTKHKKTPVQYSPDELDYDTHHFLKGLLTDYVRQMRAHGYELSAIKKALINNGHHPSLVVEVIDGVTKQALPKLSPSFLIALGMVGYPLLSLLLLLELEATLEMGILLLLPGYAAYLLMIWLVAFQRLRPYLPIIAMLVTIVGYVILTTVLTSQEISLATYDLGTILLVNVLFSGFFSLILKYSANTKKQS
ncbi:MAG: hypothetical protein QW594_04630 [Candidatus Woesearchaeota archaeon]